MHRPKMIKSVDANQPVQKLDRSNFNCPQLYVIRGQDFTEYYEIVQVVQRWNTYFERTQKVLIASGSFYLCTALILKLPKGDGGVLLHNTNVLNYVSSVLIKNIPNHNNSFLF